MKLFRLSCSLLSLPCLAFVTAFSLRLPVRQPTLSSIGTCFFSANPSTVTDYEYSDSSPPEAKRSNVNFEDWISDAPHEVKDWTPLVEIEGSIPDYVKGTLIRNGGGVWTPNTSSTSKSSSSSSSSSFNDDQYSHIFDGLAKISAYRITPAEGEDISDDDKKQNQVLYRNEFIRSEWYKMVQSQQRLPPSISTGPILSAKTKEPKTGFVRMLSAIINSLKFDNVPVNIWDYGRGQTVSALTDAPPRAELAIDDLQTKSTIRAPITAQGASGYELFLTAHPKYAKGPGTIMKSYNVALELGLQGPRINLVEELPNGDRRVVGQSTPVDNGIPYTHSFGVTDKHAIVVLQPLRIDLSNFPKVIEKGFLRAMKRVGETRVIVFDLETGAPVVETKIDEPIFFYHSISTAEKDDKISIRLCAYRVPDIITGEDQFMRLERCQEGKEWRKRISKGGTFCDLTVDLKGGKVRVDWNEKIDQGFELPTTRYSRAFGTAALVNKHPRYVYAFGSYACGSTDYDDWGLFKFDLENNCISSFFRMDSVYPSEPIFVSNPNGTNEDDGVLLSQIYDGNRRETALLVLDAATMKKQACVWTGNRSPMDFHGAWIPDKN